MDNIVYLEEIRIKKDLGRAREALCHARKLISKGEQVPKEIFEKLEKTIVVLENKLTTYVSGEDKLKTYVLEGDLQ
tara:strand:- start:445 stop:672 length:228 start_codon:yes stop_codon:yes gene_type:complete